MTTNEPFTGSVTEKSSMTDDNTQQLNVAAGARTGAAVKKNQGPGITHRCQATASPRRNTDLLAGRLALSMAEAADALGVSESSIWRLCRRGLLKHSKALRHRRIAVAELNRYLSDTAE